MPTFAPSTVYDPTRNIPDLTGEIIIILSSSLARASHIQSTWAYAQFGHRFPRSKVAPRAWRHSLPRLLERGAPLHLSNRDNIMLQRRAERIWSVVAEHVHYADVHLAAWTTLFAATNAHVAADCEKYKGGHREGWPARVQGGTRARARWEATVRVAGEVLAQSPGPRGASQPRVWSGSNPAGEQGQWILWSSLGPGLASREEGSSRQAQTQ
ncbi:hypothetical protein EDB84DRAFT_1676623 [Lactarius hengduanensis]|nr:hypothetical protein EDB84DRAFT_1676623 [Lactarius hengduanensis]